MSRNNRPPRLAEKKFIRKVHRMFGFFQIGEYRSPRESTEKLAHELKQMGILHELMDSDSARENKTKYRIRPRAMLDYLENKGTTIRWNNLNERARNAVFLKVVRGALEQMNEPLTLPYSEENSKKISRYLRELYFDIKGEYYLLPHPGKLFIHDDFNNATLRKRKREYTAQKNSTKRRLQNAFRLIEYVMIMLRKGARW